MRNYITQVNPHLNLFTNLPKLGLPSKLVSCLLYDVSLETDISKIKEYAIVDCDY